jgi:predicted RNase H-like HicB family nuclease
MIQVTGYLEKHGEMFLGWIDNFKGIAAQGNTEEEVMSKLLLLLRIKIAFDYKLPLSNVSADEACNIKHHFVKQEENKFQLHF